MSEVSEIVRKMPDNAVEQTAIYLLTRSRDFMWKHNEEFSAETIDWLKGLLENMTGVNLSKEWKP